MYLVVLEIKPFDILGQWLSDRLSLDPGLP